MAEREIRYEDIRPGDHIRFESEHYGAKLVAEGVVHHKEWDGRWVTKEGGVVDISVGRNVRIVLVDRPKRDLPEAGTWVRATTADGLEVGVVDGNHYMFVETPFDSYGEGEIEDFEELVLVPKHEYDQLTGGR